MRMFGPGTIVLGGGALLLVVFLAVGFLLPSAWEARAETIVDAPARAIMPLIDSPEGWTRWTTWPDSGTARTGPARGAGASVAWDDRELGSGRFTIDEVRPDRSVAYSVEVEGVGGAAQRTTGEISLGEAPGGGTLLRWREEGDLGTNPLMGYWARSMRRMQSSEMAKSLDRLAAAAVQAHEPSRDGDAAEPSATGNARGTPADTGSTGAR